MKDKYFPPTFDQAQFHCVLCGVYASQKWEATLLQLWNNNSVIKTGLKASFCMHCCERTFWYKTRMIDPPGGNAEPPHAEIPSECRADYLEAQNIVGRSPRGAAALLRLVVQKLIVALGETGRNINDDIGSLVSKGLPIVVQQALDFARVVGNNAVHPGELDLRDDPEVAHSIFQMINVIVEDRIARPKQIAELYNKLPVGAREAIERRDS